MTVLYRYIVPSTEAAAALLTTLNDLQVHFSYTETLLTAVSRKLQNGWTNKRWKKSDDMFSRFDTVHECDRQNCSSIYGACVQCVAR